MSDQSNIGHLAERQQLAKLRQQSDRVWSERLAALAPVEAARADRWQEILAKHEAAGGKWPDFGPVAESLSAKIKPYAQAERDVAAPFDAQSDAIHVEIDRIESAIGKQCEDYWTGEGYAVCGLTGLAILEDDKVCIVLRGALPETAAVNRK